MSVSKFIVEEIAKNMPKSNSKIVEQEVCWTREEIYLKLENKEDDSDFVRTAGVYVTVHKDKDKKVKSISIEGGYSPTEWKDITKFINALK